MCFFHVLYIYTTIYWFLTAKDNTTAANHIIPIITQMLTLTSNLYLTDYYYRTRIFHPVSIKIHSLYIIQIGVATGVVCRPTTLGPRTTEHLLGQACYAVTPGNQGKVSFPNEQEVAKGHLNLGRQSSRTRSGVANRAFRCVASSTCFPEYSCGNFSTVSAPWPLISNAGYIVTLLLSGSEPPLLPGLLRVSLCSFPPKQRARAPWMRETRALIHVAAFRCLIPLWPTTTTVRFTGH